jgi:hypothetical protein
LQVNIIHPLAPELIPHFSPEERMKRRKIPYPQLTHETEVFLRVLEYYTGILFLTTNRIGDFDEAFASRIHMSLYYPELDEDKTKKVFKLNLDLIQERFDRQGRKITFDESSIADFAEQHFREHRYSRWNGRQIRNACQTALALAEFDAHGGRISGEIDKKVAVHLQLKHFRLVQTAYLDFGRYLGDIRGTQGDRRAFDFGLRAKTDTPYQTNPSRFSGMRDGRYQSSSLSPGYPNYTHHHQSPGGHGGDPFQPLVNQGGGYGGGGGGGGGGGSGMSSLYSPYGWPQHPGSSGGGGGGYERYDSSPVGGGYPPHAGNQQRQIDPRMYQQPGPQQRQSWGENFGPGMGRGYPVPGGDAQQGQGQQQFQGQGFQGRDPQGQGQQQFQGQGFQGQSSTPQPQGFQGQDPQGQHGQSQPRYNYGYAQQSPAAQSHLSGDDSAIDLRFGGGNGTRLGPGDGQAGANNLL